MEANNDIIAMQAYARAGLAGNPSDVFFGTTVSFTMRNFFAEVYPSQNLELLSDHRGMICSALVREAGIKLEFLAKESMKSRNSEKAPVVNKGKVIVEVNLRHFCQAEVETLSGDPAKAKVKLGWTPEIMVEERYSLTEQIMPESFGTNIEHNLYGKDELQRKKLSTTHLVKLKKYCN